jgi:hypothetical protein
MTTLLVGGSWFEWIRKVPEAKVILKEVTVVAAAGQRHAGPAYVYLLQLLLAPAPWTGLYVLDVV